MILPLINMKNCFITVIIFLVSVTSHALNKFAGADTIKPEVGKPCPEFTLTHVTHYPKKQVTLNDFKGKWLFLDFWFTGCTSCIRSFPKINTFQKEFERDALFLLIGTNDKKYNRNIEAVFEKLAKNQGLSIAAAYDSTLGPRWGITTMPHIIIVDPQGIVRHITNGSDMNRERIEKLLRGESVSFRPKGSDSREFDSNLSMNSEREMLQYRSLLTSWNGERPPSYALSDVNSFVKMPQRKNEYLLVDFDPASLYNTAYFGRHYFKLFSDSSYAEISNFPILEVKNDSIFKSDDNSYNYSLFLPLDRMTKENIMKYMQQDLERVFGYRASVEKREMPVWKLVGKPETEEKMRTKGGKKYSSTAGGSFAAGFEVRNIPFRRFFLMLFFYLNEKEKHPFVDVTGMSGNIDANIDADLTDLEDVKRELKKYGMDLVLSSKKMKVIVIKDLE
jgi:thiol-disulfide isomerase/thioredoxin